MPLLLLVLVAAVQGLTEFLPVSSSGHLALIPLVTDQPYQGRAIDVAAHVGTLGAVLLVFPPRADRHAAGVATGTRADARHSGKLWQNSGR